MLSLKRRRLRRIENDANNIETANDAAHQSNDDNAEGDEDEDDLSLIIPSGTDKTPEVLDTVLAGVSPRWRNTIVRIVTTLTMLGAFALSIYIGPIALTLATLFVEIKSYNEIINIGFCHYKIYKLPWFDSLPWYFLFVSNYFLFGESLLEYAEAMVDNSTVFFTPPVRYHNLVSFCLYIGGFVWFVLSLDKHYYKKQFMLFAWIHVSLIIVTQSYCLIKILFSGIIWYIVPVSLVVCNDVMAYVFGFFFGRTPLIKLSPKKTWEGFIGGGLCTVIFGLVISYVLCQYPYFVCPIGFNLGYSETTWEICEPSPLYRPQEYLLPAFSTPLARMITGKDTVTIIPFLLHSLSMSIFSSVIGPFGGFFASGFKRAFKIKDFGDLIPGHGGVTDRCDCQFLMATFVYVYASFVLAVDSPQKLLTRIYSLNPEQQLEIHAELTKALIAHGLI